MEDFLSQNMKAEKKLHINHILRDYYQKQCTWTEVIENISRLEGCIEAIKSECDVKPDLRLELENELFPLNYFMNKLSGRKDTK